MKKNKKQKNKNYLDEILFQFIPPNLHTMHM